MWKGVERLGDVCVGVGLLCCVVLCCIMDNDIGNDLDFVLISECWAFQWIMYETSRLCEEDVGLVVKAWF